jgi:hypothetical protein
MVAAPTNTTSTPISANNGMMNIGIYSIVSAIYLIMDNESQSLDNNPRENMSFYSIMKPMSMIFLAIIWLTQFSLTFMSLKKQCNTPNYGLAAWSSFTTFFFLFVPIFVCLELNYSWLRPFGNTIGYLINKLNGVMSFMQRIMRTKSDSDKVQKYLDYMNDDPWALFSMLTTSSNAPDSINASKKFDDLKSSGYLNASLPQEAKSEFVNYVRIKENIAKFMFYVLTLNFMADVTYIIAQENSPCKINIDASSDASSYFDSNSTNQKKTVATKPPIVFKTSE